MNRINNYINNIIYYKDNTIIYYTNILVEMKKLCKKYQSIVDILIKTYNYQLEYSQEEVSLNLKDKNTKDVEDILTLNKNNKSIKETMI